MIEMTLEEKLTRMGRPLVLSQFAVDDFILDKCVLGTQMQVTVSVLWEAWEKYAQEKTHYPGSKKGLFFALRARGIKRGRTRAERYYIGITLKSFSLYAARDYAE